MIKLPTNSTKLLAIIAGSAGALLALTLAFYYYGKKSKNPMVTEIGVQNQFTEVADGERQEVDSNKIDAYDRSDRQSGRMDPARLAINDQDMAMADDMGMPTTEKAASDSRNRFERPETSIMTVDERTQRNLAVLTADPSAAVSTPSPAPSQKRSGGGSSSSRPRTQQDRDERVRHDYELASEIVQKMYGVDAQGNPIQSHEDAQEGGQQRITVPPGQSPRTASSSSVSSLDDGWGGGLSSLGTDELQGEGSDDRPFKCMFTRDEKIRNGQRVTLRTLEDIVIDGVFIPANAHISAICSVKDRLMVSVNSFESNGHIYALNMDGYDNDGALGIYCPSSANGSAANTARNDVLSVGQSAIGGRMGAIASGLVRTGVSIAKTVGSGEASVSVPAGYTFYIMKTKKRY